VLLDPLTTLTVSASWMATYTLLSPATTATLSVRWPNPLIVVSD
jgi:hypothetical protein